MGNSGANTDKFPKMKYKLLYYCNICDKIGTRRLNFRFIRLNKSARCLARLCSAVSREVWMNLYRIKPAKTIIIISAVIFCLCVFVTAYCIVMLFNAKLAVDYFSNAFLLAANIFIALFLAYYLLKSGYTLTDNEIIIKTAFFKDLLSYDKIRKIYYYATEEELYLELSGGADAEVIKINIDKKEINIFVNELKKRLPHIPYEVSLKMQIDDE